MHRIDVNELRHVDNGRRGSRESTKMEDEFSLVLFRETAAQRQSDRMSPAPARCQVVFMPQLKWWEMRRCWDWKMWVISLIRPSVHSAPAVDWFFMFRIITAAESREHLQIKEFFSYLSDAAPTRPAEAPSDITQVMNQTNWHSPIQLRQKIFLFLCVPCLIN